MKPPVPPDPHEPRDSEPSAAPGAERWARVHQLFNAALELHPDARDRFLAALDSTEHALAVEVRSLLEAHDQSSDFLAVPPELPRERVLAPGDVLGAYEIIEEIGHGGMGVIYRARRRDGNFDRDVAIKLIDPGLQSAGILRRFRAERSILAMLDHPHIVRLLDGGSAPDGSPYLVMEHVSGTSLLDYCDRRRLGVDARIELFLQVCDAVQFAHQRLVVHRDLKPDNILVTDDGSARLLDFGIAKLLAPDSGLPMGTMTGPMHRLVTPDYASPEQILGEPVSVASDVYSLGVILYELLSGARPLTFDTRTPNEVLRVATQVDPIPPSAAITRSPAGRAADARSETEPRLRRRIAGDLDYIVLRALEKQPARRYGSVEQLAQDLCRHRDGLPVLARGASTTYRMSRFLRRHSAAVVATSLVALALIAGLVGTTWQAGVARRERDLATRRFEDVRSLAHAVVFELHDAIAPLPGSTRARQLLVTNALRYLDRLQNESSGDPNLQSELAAAYFKIGDVQGQPMFSNLGQSDSASTSYLKCKTLLTALSVAWPESISVRRNLIVVTQRLAEMQHVRGHLGEALTMQLEAKRQVAAEWARHPDYELLRGDMGVACDRLFDLKLQMGDTLGAVAELREGLADIQPYYDAHPHDPSSRRAMLVSFAKLGGVHTARGERDSALANYGRATELSRQAVAELPHDSDAMRDLSVVYGMHATLLADGGAIDTALAIYDLSQRILEDLVGRDSANVVDRSGVAQGHYQIGTILMKGHRYKPAVQRFGEAFRRLTTLAAVDTSNAETRGYVARVGRAAGEACEALANHAASTTERARWRAQALDWYTRSLGAYRVLDARGALAAGEATAPDQLATRVAALRGESGH